MVSVPDREALTGFVMLLVPVAVLCQGAERLFPPTSHDYQGSGTSLLHGPVQGWPGHWGEGTGGPHLPDFMEMGLQWSSGICLVQLQGLGHHWRAEMGLCNTRGATWHTAGCEQGCAAPRGVAQAQLLGEAIWASRGETPFSTLSSSLIMRSYTGAYARNQPKHAGSRVQKKALCQRFGRPPRRCWQESSPCPSMTVLAEINSQSLQTDCNDTGICKGFSQITVRLVAICFYEKEALQWNKSCC